jgi:hypothetical protein
LGNHLTRAVASKSQAFAGRITEWALQAPKEYAALLASINTFSGDAIVAAVPKMASQPIIAKKEPR